MRAALFALLAAAAAAIDAPTDVSATAGDTQAVVSWSFAAGADGADAARFEVAGSPDGSVSVSDGAARSATVTGLSNGQSYTFTVTAYDADDAASAASAASAAVVPFGVPGAVASLSVTDDDVSAMTVSWTAPSDDNGAAVTQYTVSIGTVTETTTGTSFTTTFDVDWGSEYSADVRATNAAGSGATTATTYTPLGVPSAVNDLAAAPELVYVDVSWAAPDDARGSAVQSYDVSWAGGSVTGVTDTSARLGLADGLALDTDYFFTVVANNAQGSGDEATLADAVQREDSWCDAQWQQFVCSEDCSSFYYCNGPQRGEDVACSAGACNMFGGLGTPDTCAGGGGSCWSADFASQACAQVTCSGHGVCDEASGTCACEDPWYSADGATDVQCDLTDDDDVVDQCLTQLEMMILLDGSGSVGADSYVDEQAFALDLMAAFVVGEDKTEVGLVQFATDSVLQSALTGSVTALAVSVFDDYLSSWTNIVDALLDSQDQFDTLGDPVYPDITFLVTDGNPTAGCGMGTGNDNTEARQQCVIDTADDLKADNITLFAIGVGDGVNPDMLTEACTQPPAYYYANISNFEDLGTLLDALVEEVCFTVTGLDATEGCFTGGETVYVSGRGFGRAAHSRGRCKFGDTEVQATWISSTLMSCVTPFFPVPDTGYVAQDSVLVTVSITSGASYLAYGLDYTVLYDPDCQGVADSSIDEICSEGGDLLELTGTGFGTTENDGIFCQFGDFVGLVKGTWVSDELLYCTSPPWELPEGVASEDLLLDVSLDGGATFLPEELGGAIPLSVSECLSFASASTHCFGEVKEVTIAGTGFLQGTHEYDAASQTVVSVAADVVVRFGALEPVDPLAVSDTSIVAPSPHVNTTVDEARYEIDLSFDGGLSWLNTTLWYRVDPCEVYPDTWWWWLLVVVALLLCFCACGLVYVCNKLPHPMPELNYVAAPEPKKPKPKKQGKKHWAVSASNYLGSQGVVAVKWGKYGANVDGERAVNDDLSDEEDDFELDLEEPPAPPLAKPAWRFNKAWWAVLLAVIVLALVLYGAVDAVVNNEPEE